MADHRDRRRRRRPRGRGAHPGGAAQPLRARRPGSQPDSDPGPELGLRAVALVLCGALYTTAVDPDDVLRLFRRFSFRSALTAAISTRMLPVLIRDSRRLADAQRCRPGRPPSRVALMRAATAGVLDRALDTAAALEVRGYGAARRTPRTPRPYSRHDLDRKSTRLNSSHVAISYAVFCLKK